VRDSPDCGLRSPRRRSRVSFNTLLRNWAF